MQEALWHHYLEVIHENAATAEPWGRDRGRVEALLAELYRLGERPPRREIASFLQERYGENSGLFRKTLLDLWSGRLRTPHRRWRGEDGWVYPFVHAHQYVTAHGLETVASRLATVVATAAQDLAVAIDTAPASDHAYLAADELRAAQHALDLWHRVQDRYGDDWLGPNVIPRPRPRSETQSFATRRGREQNPYTKYRPGDAPTSSVENA